MTAVSWSLCGQFFGAAGLRVGSSAVNHVRLALAVAILPLLHFVVLGTLLPLGMPARDALLFMASGFVGLTLGDALYFHALVLIGPAGATLMVTITPAIACLLAWTFLGEALALRAVLGIAVTVGGIALAVRARLVRSAHLPDASRHPARTWALGLLLALGGATGQAVGQVLARPALAHEHPLSATVVRIATGAGALWALTCVRRIFGARPAWWPDALRDRRAMALTALGTLTGPVLGVLLSQVATKHAPVAVAATLMSIVPVLIIAQDAALGRRRPSGLEVIGALTAIAGVALVVGWSPAEAPAS